jgi:DNA-binding NtrC family response regulator
MIPTNFVPILSTDQTILILGATGTGKTHLGRKIHDLSPRKNGKFVSVNLATLSENLIESELFGHERGSFTGAETKRVGRLESAEGGTVLLDEIGELSLRLQTKLLDVMNHNTIVPVGSNREVKLNVRFIVATNKDLASEVKEGRFREDLFFRVQTCTLRLPSLMEDSGRAWGLAKNLLEAACVQQGKQSLRPCPSLEEFVRLQPWPGNIRQLKMACDFAVAVCSDGMITASHFPPSLQLSKETIQRSESYIFPSEFKLAKEQFERLYLEQILERCGGRINRTARTSGISKVTLIDKVRRYQINVPAIRWKNEQETKQSCN